jgi:tRNA dimethylallyltransferase
MNKNLIVLLGPTGVGKTAVSIDLATHYRCDIISADSRQIFREMSIGTAVPDDQQLNRVRHHFIKSISVTDYYSSSIFEREVLSLLEKLFKDGHTVIMAGGSGMYIDAVCNGIDDIPDVDPSIREKYSMLYLEQGINGLRIALKMLDPVHYTQVDLRNYKRIIRALEICETSGKPYSAFLTGKRLKRDFGIIKIGLQRDREDLYRRINDRVDDMIAGGLEDEVRQMSEFRHLNALNSVGYREFFDCFDGKIPRDKAIELIKRNSRRYAKRQMTWWARDNSIRWFHPENISEIFMYTDKTISAG